MNTEKIFGEIFFSDLPKCLSVLTKKHLFTYLCVRNLCLQLRYSSIILSLQREKILCVAHKPYSEIIILRHLYCASTYIGFYKASSFLFLIGPLLSEKAL